MPGDPDRRPGKEAGQQAKEAKKRKELLRSEEP
jgi:hypothetical protein